MGLNFPQKKKREVAVHDEFVRPQDDPKAEHANHLIRSAGDSLRRGGYRYLGSGVVHYYDSLLAPNEFIAIKQTPGLERVPEGFADVGWKQLRSVMMRVYGRKPIGEA